MELETLNRHCYLVQKLREAQELYKTTEAKTLGAQSLDGMPHGTGVSDKVGALGVALADISAYIDYLEKQVAESAAPINDFICGIDDLKTRLVFRYRFLYGFAWGEVADMLGKRVTESTVKSICYDYLESLKKS